MRMENGRLTVEADSARCIALLSVLSCRPLGPEILRPIEAAAAYWAAGEKALANLRLVFSGLPTPGSTADAHRLTAAAWCLDQGLTPRELMKALDLDPSVLDLRKYDPNQPRVPAGSGRESGRWTTEAGEGDRQFVPSSKPEPIRVAANGPFRPEGVEAAPSDSVDPLDPAGLNQAPPSPQEQKAIVDTLNTIANGTPDEIKKLQPHNNQNLPHDITGAILPPDPQGYTSYNVPTAGDTARGLRRLVLNKSRTQAYYTSNHYQSFFHVNLN